MKFNDTEIIKFLSRLQENNIEIYVSNNNLQIIDNNDSITEEILSDIKNNKAQILRILQQNVTNEINIEPKARGVDLPLSFAQERLWFIDQYEHNASYNIPGAVKLIGKLNINVLEKTFSEIIRRHEVLRTNILTINNVPSQLIHKESKFELKTVDQSHLPEEEANQKIKGLIEIESQKPFDLANDSLIRLVLYKINDEEHTLFLNKHHIISDGWSFSVFFKEISILYKAFCDNKPSPLPELEIQYADYAVWQREHIEGEILTKQSEYWKNKLSGTAILELPADKMRPSEQTFNGTILHFSLGKDISEKLNTFSKGSDATLFMTLLSAFNVLLNKYTGQDDICVGTPIANRTRSEIEPLIGFFVNTLALRSDLSGGIRFVDLVKQVKQTTLDAYGNQDMPFEKVVDVVQPERNLSYSPLFQVMLVLQNTPVGELSFGDLRLCPIEFESTVSRFDLAISFTETAEGLIGGIEYNTDLFDKDRIERMIGHLKVLVESIISNPTAKISDLEILTSTERHKLLIEWNNTEADYPKDKCIHQLFEIQVEKTPDNIAVVFEKEELTYRQLNEKSNKLGHYLRRKGVKADTPVGICIERSLDMIVGLLGILKAGGAYVPIDIEYPEERIKYILEDSNTQNIIVNSKTIDKIALTNLIGNGSNYEEPVITPKCKQIDNLNILPHPDRTLIDYSKYHKHIGIGEAKHTISIQTSRGCPYHCAFCHKIWPKKHIFRDADDVLNEILKCYEAGVSRFVFIDDIFNLNKENSGLLLEKIINSGIDIQLFFPNGLRGDILTEEFIDLMIKAGTVNIDLALESASPRIQKLIKKNVNLTNLKNNINYIARKYPHVVLELEMMIGFPSETEEEAMMTLDFINDIKWLHFPNLNILKVFPGTDMYQIAIENGITDEQINSSTALAYHELPNTLPYSKSFVREFQANFINNYFLSKERLNHVLKYQFKNFTKSEIIEKYDSYLPTSIKSIEDLLKLANIKKDFTNQINYLPDNYRAAPDFNLKIKKYFPEKQKRSDAYKILFIDLSLLFTSESENALYDMYEAPLGLMYLLSYLNQEFGENINGKIFKSRIDFDAFEDLKELITDFNPNLIAIRTLSIYKDFFHVAVSKMKHWFPHIPIITGGPYATSDYKYILQDKNVEMVVRGEGELVLADLIRSILENNNRIPDYNELEKINSLAYIDKETKSQNLKNIIQIDELQEQLEAEQGTNLSNINKQSDLFYIIYTSGSTGKPKGVMLEHSNLINLVSFTHNMTNIDFSSVLQFVSLSFDVSAQEIFGTLLYGGKLVLIDNDIRFNTTELFQEISENKVKTVYWPVSLTKLIFEQENKLIPQCISHIITAGEQLVVNDNFNKYLKENNVFLHNHYGPSETHVVTTLTIKPDESYRKYPSIGRPISNTSVFILDKNMNLAPINIKGELYFSGDQVGRGYYKRTELTKEKFIKNSFSSDPKSRLYKTGDLARYLPDGNIEFLGRADDQVKIRGYRIELGEIEFSLNKLEGINTSVVIAKNDKLGNKYLVAYVVQSKEVTELSIEKLREDLSKSLPDYMVPSLFVKLEAFPLTPNGKINKKALPDPEGNIETTNKYVAPQNDIEKKLAAIWSKVLGVEKVGVYDNFFELGGHSLLATQVISKIRTEFNNDLPVKVLFENSTIKTLSKQIDIGKLDVEQLSTIPVSSRDGDIPLSFAQERLWFIDQYEHNGSYNLSEAVKINGKFDLNILEKTFSEIIRRHEVLRTNIVVINNVAGQLIHKESKREFKIVDQSHLMEKEANQKIKGLIEIESQKPFDLANDSLIRLVLYKISDEEHTLFLNQHHIISDGWSLSVFLKEISTLYKAFSENKPSPLPELEIQYADYAVWQREHIKGEVLTKQSEYWKNKLSGTAILELPADKTRPSEQTFKGANLYFNLNKGISDKLNAFSQENEVTLFMTLLSVFNVLLNRYTGQNDICVGTPIANRTRSEIEPLIGFFVNTLALRSDLSEGISFVDLVKQVRQTTLDAYGNQDIPFEKVVDIVQPERNLAYSPLFQVMIVLQNNPREELSFGDLRLSPIEFESNVSKFDLTINFTETAEGLVGGVEYNTDLFCKDRIERMIGHLNALLESIISNPTVNIAELEILTCAEKHKLLVEWNDTEIDYSKDKCIHQLFEEQVEKTPTNIAVVFEDNRLTYRELNKKANRLARYLQSGGVKPDSLVGICVDRSLEMIIGLLGILKAGGAYVPIDPTYSEERISYMLEDAGCEIVLSQEHLKLPETCSKIIYLDADWGRIEREPAANAKSEVKSDNLSYVIYTSGTTGRPKGAMLNHTGIVNRLEWMQAMYPLTSEDVVLQKTPYVFDVSVWELLWAHWYGAIIVLAKPEGHKDSEYLHQLIEKSNVTTLHFVPSMLDAYNQYLIEQRIKLSAGIKQIFCSGEALNKNVVEQTYQNSESKIFRLHNLYGPTEASVDVTYFETSPTSNVYIGRPIDNTQVYILDSNHAPVPIGVIGELYLGGVGLSRGYLKRPELTAERFVPNPFATAADKANGYDRLYRTGDLVRWMPDGNIEYLGRNDDQIKIRGFRIELGEIEQALSQVPCIKQCCVLAKERKTETGSNKYLAGYYVASKDSVEERANFMMDHYKEKILDNNLSFYMLNKDLSAFTFRKSELEFLYRELFQSNTYSSHITISSGDIIFDVGANIGIGSLFFAQQADDLTIYSFEPIGNLYDVLTMNLFIYSQKASFKTFNCGIGAENQNDVKFSFFRNNTVISSQYPDLEGDSKLMSNYLDTTSKSSDNKELVDLIIESQEEVTCQIRTISTIICEEKIKRIDLLKIDVEKAEMDVLNGIEEQDWDKICQIVIEVHDKNNRLEIIKNMLVHKGYTVYAQQDTDLQNSELYIVYAIRKSIDTVSDKKDEKTLFDNNIITELLKTYKGWKGNGNLVFTDMLYEHLKTTLPEYMIPSIFIRMETFPLTVNGKLDKRSLPDPDFSLTAQEYVAPANEKEAELCKVWQDILGLERVGITDNFFKIGGNSILAIQASHRMSKTLEGDIRVADIFRLKSIDKILAAQDQYYELVKPYNFNYRADLADMIFISPGLAGSEMYQNMAESIAARYNCIGIDNYNLHNNEKIDSLNKLANHYLSEFEKKYTLKEPVNLLGWSLGGQIALEMAVILEERGYKNINVILLDTYLRDEKMRNLISAQKRTDDFVDSEKQKLIAKYGPEYFEKISLAQVAENKISNTPISNGLKYSKIILFKAIQEYEGVNTEDAKLLFEHYKSLKLNNIDLAADNVNVIKLDCNHFDILKSSSKTISNFLLFELV